MPIADHIDCQKVISKQAGEVDALRAALQEALDLGLAKRNPPVTTLKRWDELLLSTL